MLWPAKKAGERSVRMVRGSGRVTMPFSRTNASTARTWRLGSPARTRPRSGRGRRPDGRTAGGAGRVVGRGRPRRGRSRPRPSARRPRPLDASPGAQPLLRASTHRATRSRPVPQRRWPHSRRRAGASPAPVPARSSRKAASRSSAAAAASPDRGIHHGRPTLAVETRRGPRLARGHAGRAPGRYGRDRGGPPPPARPGAGEAHAGFRAPDPVGQGLLVAHEEEHGGAAQEAGPVEGLRSGSRRTSRSWISRLAWARTASASRRSSRDKGAAGRRGWGDRGELANSRSRVSLLKASQPWRRSGLDPPAPGRGRGAPPPPPSKGRSRTCARRSARRVGRRLAADDAARRAAASGQAQIMASRRTRSRSAR